MTSPLWSRTVVVCLAMAALGLGGCATSTSGGGGGGGNRNLIGSEELQEVLDLNAYEAVRRLRPAWLRSRTTDGPSVYVDGMRGGGMDDLRTLDTADIQEIRFLSASDATTRFGTNNVDGAILVTTRR